MAKESFFARLFQSLFKKRDVMAKEEKTEVRIDKWLWAVRLFKTRSIAADACKKGKVMMQGSCVKASRNVKVGDVVQIKRPPVVYSFEVLALSENRMGAKLVPKFMKNVTPPEQFEILEMSRYSAFGLRDRGTGRPTKKERRDLETYMEPDFIDPDLMDEEDLYDDDLYNDDLDSYMDPDDFMDEEDLYDDDQYNERLDD